MCDPIVTIKHNYMTIQDHWSVIKNLRLTLTEQIDSEVSGFVRITIIGTQFKLVAEIDTDCIPAANGNWLNEAVWHWSLYNDGQEIQHNSGRYGRMITNEALGRLLSEIHADRLS